MNKAQKEMKIKYASGIKMEVKRVIESHKYK